MIEQLPASPVSRPPSYLQAMNPAVVQGPKGPKKAKL